MTSTTQAVATVLTEVATAILSKFRRKWLERLNGERVFISDGRETARVQALEAASDAEHAQRNAEQVKLLEAEANRLAQEKAEAERKAANPSPPSAP